MSNGLTEAADKVRHEVKEKVEAIRSDSRMSEVLKLHRLLNGLEEVAGEPLTQLAALFGLEGVTNEAPALSIRADEYYGLTPLEAAKRYLKRKGQARPFQEIVVAVRSGGCKVDNEDELRRSMTRSTYEVAKVGEDLFGLVEFYSHVKRGKKRAGAADLDVDTEERTSLESASEPDSTTVNSDPKPIP
jgi:hypothetical protein